MNKLHRRLGPWLLAGLVAAAGCTREDAGRLARVGRKGLDRARAALATVTCDLPADWQSGAEGLQDGGLDLRVSARLRWDKTLAAIPIEVKSSGGVVELRGKVQGLTQRRRAVEIAETTAGVEKVSDLLQTEAP
jgi:hypothetical protein